MGSKKKKRSSINSQRSVETSHTSKTSPTNSLHKKSQNIYHFLPIIIITKENKWFSAALIGENVFIICEKHKAYLKCSHYLNIISESNEEYYNEASFIKNIIYHENFVIENDNQLNDKFDIVILEQNLGKSYDEKRTTELGQNLSKDTLESYLIKHEIKKGKYMI